jgi:hypothetical protein
MVVPYDTVGLRWCAVNVIETIVDMLKQYPAVRYRDDTGWIDDGTVGIFRYPFWRRKKIRHLQNSLIPLELLTIKDSLNHVNPQK